MPKARPLPLISLAFFWQLSYIGLAMQLFSINKELTMTTLMRRLLPLFVLAACGMLSFAQPGGEKDTKEEIAEMKVRLRLIVIETAKLTEHFTTLVGREITLKENVKAAINAADARLPDYEQALAD